ncbi:MAG TPA: DUF971 domain-containing protein [Blastocatellia bacterium]|nr:DUF971 domain-containing protein [Blastocatellia bacterium]
MSHSFFRYPREINLVSASNSLEIIWDDGHVSLYPLGKLRAICQCATCTDKHHQTEKPAKSLSLPILGLANRNEVESLSHVGRYALGVLWKDEHDSIYPFDALSSQCLCEECTAKRALVNEHGQ